MKIMLTILMLASLTLAQKPGVETVTGKTEGKPGLEKHEGKGTDPTKPVKKEVDKQTKKN